MLGAAFGIFAKAAGDEFFEFARSSGWELGWIFAYDSSEGGHWSGGLEGAVPADHFIENSAEGEDVRAGVDGLAFCLLRRHVGGGADDGTFRGVGRTIGMDREGGCGFARTGQRLGELGQTEIEDLDAALGIDHNVCRFEVAMGDASGMGFGEGIGDLNRVFEGVV